MRKYKLVKTYPGSPELGTEVEKRDSKTYMSNTYLTFRNDNVEDNPEYWEKVEENMWWCFWEEDFTNFKTWTPYRIENIPAVWETKRHYFKTKEEAERYIVKNKPCLSLNEVSLIMGGLEKKRDIFLELQRIVKSRL